MIKSEFPKYLGRFGSGEESEAFDKYEIRSPLPDDGTGEIRYIQIFIEVKAGEPSTVTMDVCSEVPSSPKMPRKIKRVGCFTTGDDKVLADLLYPVAGLKTFTAIVPR